MKIFKIFLSGTVLIIRYKSLELIHSFVKKLPGKQKHCSVTKYSKYILRHL